ncbi:hypothetical protein AB6A40_000101 [Gnathostoma spinigerum]|uniref:Protein quiver n=1 Tax=Gnathostoma spinigerum TaxID=75299 RepID=A0ABD6E3H1_9BILA
MVRFLGSVVYFVMIPMVSSTVCYKCASEAIVMHWGRYLPIQSGDDVAAEPICLTGNSSMLTVPCDGACLLLNVTYKSQSGIRTIGILRDCRNEYFTSDDGKMIKEWSCVEKQIEIRRRILNAQYCFCDSDYCNGPQRPVIISFFSRRRPSHRRNTALKKFSGTFWSFLSPVLLLYFV